MKRFAVLLLCFCLLLTAAAPAFAVSPDARLYNVCGNDMLFQRESDAILAGEAPDVRTVYRLAEVAREHLEYVYTGNC